MFLSKGHRDLRFAFQTHPGSQASCQREAKDSALLSSRVGHLLEPTLWPKGSQASCEVWREDVGLLSRPCRKRWPAQSWTRLKRLSSSSSSGGWIELWFWRRLLGVPCTARSSNQLVLKEINLEYSLEGLMLKLRLQHSGHLM